LSNLKKKDIPGFRRLSSFYSGLCPKNLRHEEKTELEDLNGKQKKFEIETLGLELKKGKMEGVNSGNFSFTEN
jgi:hypothetical protein